MRDALEEPGEGRVLVVAGGGSKRCALVGGNLGILPVDNGWAGIGVDGCVRDAAELREAKELLVESERRRRVRVASIGVLLCHHDVLRLHRTYYQKIIRLDLFRVRQKVGQKCSESNPGVPFPDCQKVIQK